MNVPYIDVKKNYSSLKKELREAFEEVIDSGRIVLGPKVEKFEEKYAKFSGTKYCIGVGCGLDAITLSLQAAGVGEGDEVIVPSNAYIAALMSISHLKARPVFVEPKPSTFNIDASLIEQAITKRTKAVIPVHFFGQACEMKPIQFLCKKYNIEIIEDNAQSQGSSYDGRMTGSFGISNATSFYPTKNLGAIGEAGAVTTDDKEVYDKIKMLRNYGEKSKYLNEYIGYNSRLDELQAAFLLVKMKKLNQWTKARQRIAKLYLSGLSGIEGLIPPVTEEHVVNVYHIFPIRTKLRDALQKYLFDHGISTSIHYPKPPHMQKAYSYLGYKKGDFPIAEELAETSLSLPIFPEMADNQIAYVIDSIKRFYTFK